MNPNPIREEVARLEVNAENHIEPDIYEMAIADVLSVLDRYEVVVNKQFQEDYSITIERWVDGELEEKHVILGEPGHRILVFREKRDDVPEGSRGKG